MRLLKASCEWQVEKDIRNDYAFWLIGGIIYAYSYF